MNRDQFQGKWKEFKGKVKQKWGKLTDNDITQINGKWDQLVGKLQQQYGWSKEQAEREANQFCSSCDQKHHSIEENPSYKKEEKNEWNKDQSQGHKKDQSYNKDGKNEWNKDPSQQGHKKENKDNNDPWNKDKKRKAG